MSMMLAQVKRFLRTSYMQIERLLIGNIKISLINKSGVKVSIIEIRTINLIKISNNK